MKSNDLNKIKFYVCHGLVLPFVLTGLYVFIVRDHAYWGAAFIAVFWSLQIYGDYRKWITNGNRNSSELDSGSVLQRRHCSCSCHEPNIKPVVED